MERFLVETALLTHGLASISDEEILQAWNLPEENIAWIKDGEVVVGGIQRYLAFRREGNHLLRIDCQSLDNALEQGLTGALTASGTMALCQRRGIPLAVTCGMGGIGDIEAERLCPDLPALAAMNVALLSTGPKDMLDGEATLRWLQQRGVRICGVDTDYHTGYLFVSARVPVERVPAEGWKLPAQRQLLILNPIAECKRVEQQEILLQGIAAGKRAEAQGSYYHPAANREFDRLTKGYSSRLQLESLINNVRLARLL